jgi:hypothetical protein
MSAKLAGMNIILLIGFSAAVSFGKRFEVMSNWPARRCEPGIVASAGLYQPADDKRSAGEFMQDNFQFCQGKIAAAALDQAAGPVKFLQGQQANVVNTITSNIAAVEGVSFSLASIFNEIIESVKKRFSGTYVEISNSFAHLWNVMQKIMASMTAVFLALIGVLVTFTSMIQVAMYVIAIVVGILIALMVILAAFFGYLLAPVNWLIFAGIAVIGIIMGAVVGIVASNGFCLGGESEVEMKDGSVKPLDTVQVGDELASGFGKVTATMKFLIPQNERTPLVKIHGVAMSKTHLVEGERTGGKAIPAGEHRDAIYASSRDWLYNLNTSSRRIPIQSLLGRLIVLDYEEIAEDNEAMLAKWKRWVFKQLNGQDAFKDDNPNNEEAALDGSLLIELKDRGLLPISQIKPGDQIRCSEGFTTVCGTVKLLIEKDTPLYGGMTAGVWFANKAGIWTSAMNRKFIEEKLKEDNIMYHLFTEAGDFQLEDCFVRDFSEVGLKVLHNSYDFVCGK